MQFSSSYEHACLYSPGIEATYHSFLHRPGDIAGTSIELHCHPRNGVPMTVIFHPAPGMTESGKPIRIDMLQAGEYGPRHIHKPSDPPYLMEIAGLPFLSPNEYCRAKLRRWTAYDVPHLCWMVIAQASSIIDMTLKALLCRSPTTRIDWTRIACPSRRWRTLSTKSTMIVSGRFGR